MSAHLRRQTLAVLGSGSALPGGPISSEELIERMAMNFGVPTRTGYALTRALGIRSRHFSRDFNDRLEAPRRGCRNPELAASALSAALRQAALEPAHLQYLLAHTATPARQIPPNVSELASIVGHSAPYAELRQACTGFANALQWAAGLLTGNESTPVAIVGSEVGSVYLDPAVLSEPGARDQWVNLLQMGDGAGAIVLGPYRGEGPAIENPFFGHMSVGRQPAFALNDGGSDHPGLQPGRSGASFSHDFGSVRSEGPALFRAAIAETRAAGYTLQDFRYIIPHQVNARIGRWLSAETGIAPDRFFVHADRLGNLGSAAIWVALHALRRSGRLRSGDRVLALGAEATHHMYGGFVYVHADAAMNELDPGNVWS